MLQRRTVQLRTKQMAEAAAGLSMPSRARMQETCRSPFSPQPEVPVNQLLKLCRAEVQQRATTTSTLPCCLSSNTKHLDPNFPEPNFAAQQGLDMPLHITTHQAPSMHISCCPKHCFSNQAPKRCLLDSFHLSLDRWGKKERNEEGASVDSRGMQAPATSPQACTG